jgi:cytochrome c-type biogenesis protein CcmF
MTEAGRIALMIALPAAAFSAVTAIAGARAASRHLYKSARIGLFVVFGLYTLALVILLYAFFTRDFSIRIVAEHTSRDLPALYTFSALYADKAGSMSLWGWLTALFSVLLMRRTDTGSRPTLAYAIAILAVIEAFIITLVIFVVNVFAANSSLPADGFGLNPLLQNLGMLIHPPLLYIGFAGFAIVFALVMAALIARVPGTWENNLLRPWALFAWGTLGIGNIVGMWWSYNELGWGGYWAWDPVENAGLMPWLLGTAFLHSMAVRGRRDYLQVWSYYLCVFTFVFTLMSPFITHGGIESPLHGFYGSPFPPYILAAMLIVITSAIVLWYLRRRDLEKGEKPDSILSREGVFLLTNIILVVLVGVIFIGTVLPRIMEALGGTKIAIDRSFFDRTCGPIMLLLVFLMGVCPLFGWGKTVWKSAGCNIIFFFAAAIIISAAIIFSGIGNWYIAVVVLCGLPLFIISREWWRGTAARRRSMGKNGFSAFISLFCSHRARYGGFLAHIGIVSIALGIITSSFYSAETMATLDIGESMSVGRYELSYEELIFKQDSAKVSAVADMAVTRNGRRLGIMRPSYDYWFNYDDFFAEVAVRTTVAEDLFVSLAWTDFDPENKTATFRVLVNPLVVWIWIGGGFFLAGGVLSFSHRDKEEPTERSDG